MAKPDFKLIWGETAPSVPIPAPSYAAGWDAYLGSNPPLGSDHDYVMNQHDIKLAYLNAQGIAEWDALTAYDTDAYAKGSDGELYRSTAPTTGNDPTLGGPWSSASATDYLNTVRQDVVSAATTVLPDTTRHVNITGAATITAFTAVAGTCYFVRFAGAVTLTNNASIVTQSGANIVAAAGDTCLIRATATDVVEILCYTRASGAIGYDQAWQDVTVSRALNVFYTNTTGRPIEVLLSIIQSSGAGVVIVGGVSILDISPSNTNEKVSFSFIVPDGEQYAYSIQSGSQSLSRWSELR